MADGRLATRGSPGDQWRRRQGDLLRRLRTERGLTQEELGAEIDAKPTTVCYWETGRLPIAPEFVGHLAAMLRVELKPFAVFVAFCQNPVLGALIWPDMVPLFEQSLGCRGDDVA